MNHKERYHAMLEGKPVDRVPVTPIFMAWSAHHIGKTYRDYYLKSEVLVESQLAAARLLNLDQVSVISDPWCEASGYGMTFDFPEEGVGIPHDHLLHNHADVKKLKVLDIKNYPRLQQRVDSVARLAQEVGEHTSVLGWVEGPIAEYTDLRDMQPAMLDLVTEPQMYQDAMEPIIQTAITFAIAQIQAGADTIGVGDAAASLIGPDLYVEHVLPWGKKIVRRDS